MSAIETAIQDLRDFAVEASDKGLSYAAAQYRAGASAVADLRDENAKLREALERIAAYDAPDAHAMIEQAKAALR